ncbi:hypothetical protein J6590_066304 [Homalodisca vitripennis]|nr:hypothetical protein J6590_066304 [Homalodisca vitripennis]
MERAKVAFNISRKWIYTIRLPQWRTIRRYDSPGAGVGRGWSLSIRHMFLDSQPSTRHTAGN